MMCEYVECLIVDKKYMKYIIFPNRDRNTTMDFPNEQDGMLMKYHAPPGFHNVMYLMDIKICCQKRKRNRL